MRLGAGEHLGEALVIERLEQVVERVHLEGLEGIGVVRGDEDDGGGEGGAHLAQHLEAVHARHLHVQEEHVHRVLAQGLHRLGAAGALAHHLDFGVRREQRQEPLPGDALVVHHQHAHGGGHLPRHHAEARAAARR